MFGSRKAKQPAAASIGANGLQPSGTQPPAAQSQGKRKDPAGNDGKAPSAGGPSSEQAKRRAAIAMRQSLAFAQIISVLMRAPRYKHYTLADLEWLVLPPLLTGQFSVARSGAKEGGPRIPLAVALWASVSPEVDKRLTEDLSAPVRLRPDEWRSGEILWLVDAVGDGRVVAPLLKQLGETSWKGRDVKTRSRGADGRQIATSIGNVLGAAKRQ